MMKIDAIKHPIALVIILFSLTTCKRSEPEINLAVTTEDIIVDPEGIYILNGTLVSIGEGIVTEHGFCYSVSGDPEIDGTSIELGPRKLMGRFSTSLSGLTLNTIYYVKAYAIANSIPVYGDEKSFKTPVTLVPTLTDVDNNVYHIKNIGDQTWMAENLRVIHYPDKTPIKLVEDRVTWFNFALHDQAYTWYDNMPTNYNYGVLYTWPAAMHGAEVNDPLPEVVQGVCPDGWHLPSDIEWKQLEMFLGMSQVIADEKSWRGTAEGGKLKQQGTSFWTSPNIGATDESGFNALPGGWRHGDGYFKNLGITARFWTSTKTGDFAWIRGLDNNSSKVFREFAGVYEGHSVRCIKNK